tara:strand:- start:349 stop:555 length:207 start_codon:yes stop_codon:yes gene_type:complete
MIRVGSPSVADVRIKQRLEYFDAGQGPHLVDLLSATITPPGGGGALLLEDNTSFLLLEDGSSKLLKEV